jgi:general secretion pathway protein H
MSREAGFSLIEMLVVVAIISLAAGVAVISAPGPSGQLAQETDRLIRSLVAARDLALIENRTVTVELSETGYVTRVATRSGPAREVEAARWGDGTTIATRDNRLPAMVTFDPIGLAEPASFTLFRDGAKDGVAVDPSGDIRRLDDDRQT